MPRSNPRRTRHLAVLAAGGLLTGGLFALTPATASPGEAGPSDAPSEAGRDTGHEPKHPLKIKEKRDLQLQAALERKLTGQAPAPDDRSVKLRNEGTDRIFVVLAEFGNERYQGAGSAACGAGCFTDNPPYDISDPEPKTFDGPLHNQIPKPDRTKDNSTLWQADYNRAHYEDMYFNRMASYYERQSSGRYSVDGDVTEWVKVPYNQALYGRGYCGNPPGAPVTTCASTKALVRDALAVWVDQQLKSGKTMAEIQDYLKTFDIQDRYDIDGDGNLQEPDGFIDHFQIVHAGGDEAAGDPTYGTDAIWSHRWYSNLQAGGPGGLPGVNIGSNAGAFGKGADPANPVPNHPTGVWVGDYTIQPENGGLGVFAHEFGHDLGLPDLYDTSGNTGGAENSTGFWSLMSSGANIGDGGPDGIGDAPTDLGAWELFQLGWLNKQGGRGPFYDVARAGQTSTHTLGTNVPLTDAGAQALFTVLPDKKVPLALGAPYAGSQMFWSTQGDDLNTSMTKTGVSAGNLTAQVNYQIETDWDYTFLEAQVGGAWTPVATNLSDTAGDQSGFNGSKTGMTGATSGWTAMTATLPAGTTAVRFRYQTDGAVAEPGFRVDNIAVNGTTIGTAETADEGWEFGGFVRTTGSEVQEFFNAYVAENRQYDGYDTSLRTAYNFSTPLTNPDRVESYPYQNGLLISYWNSQYTDNNVGDHPGEGLILPIDSHPTLPHWSDGTLMRPRAASYDSTFGLEKTDAITLHTQTLDNAGRVVNLTGAIASQAAVPTFDDTGVWWYASDAHVKKGAHPGRYQPGWYSVDPPNTGTTITVQSTSGSAMTVKVAPK
ncbi:immune inhibitor A domain-containing protein [Nocardioides sp.]|uniref:immune inhibitor A domain-containing protein n=1 Tax=Nocardioides sp. TaxID=35761 RepID=UPI002D7E33D2|nr:immune inhibitor A domain-containing protein [Nocardioides sp.]HET8959766.1 immune inhibitor A domain-containing protein [Nocardioides sp.]